MFGPRLRRIVIPPAETIPVGIEASRQVIDTLGFDTAKERHLQDLFSPLLCDVAKTRLQEGTLFNPPDYGKKAKIRDAASALARIMARART